MQGEAEVTEGKNVQPNQEGMDNKETTIEIENKKNTQEGLPDSSPAVKLIPDHSVLHRSRLGRIGRFLKLHVHLHKSKKMEKKEKTKSQFNHFREWLGGFMESFKFQVVILVLLIADILLLIAELIVEAHWPHEHKVEDILRYTSIGILSVFALEQVVLLFCFDLDYFRHPMYIIDALVVGSSLFIEIVLRSILGGFIALFRLWRIVRVVHGIVISVEEAHHHQEIKLLKHLKKIEYDLENGQVEAALQSIRTLEESIPLSYTEKLEFFGEFTPNGFAMLRNQNENAKLP